MIHELKTWCEQYDAIEKGEKTFEVRKNDRSFLKGDLLILKEWDNDKQEYTGRKISKIVKYILDGGQFGIEPGFVCMSI